MEFGPGDLVQYKNAPGRLAIIINVDATSSGAEVCELVIVHDKSFPDTVGEKRYTNQDYWRKIPQKTIQQVETLHRKEQNDKQTNEERAWTRDD